MYQYVCSRCGKKAPVTTTAPCCDCGGLWKLDFFRPFDPALIDRSQWNMFRYRAFMPLEDDSWRSVTLGEGLSPVIAFDSDLMLKLDYCMPTLSFKDRGAAALISHCRSIGVTQAVQDSSGNAGNSVAAYCARAGIRCGIYVPEGTSPAKIAMIRAHGAEAVVVPGSRDHCADVCRARVREEGVFYANHVYNPYFYEGTKTYVYELYEQLGRVPENIFIPTGNGTLFLGAVKGLEELLAGGCIDHMPNVVMIQSEKCAPIAEARRLGLKDIAKVTPEPTLAEGVAIGVPMRGAEILAAMEKYGFSSVLVPEEAILDARARLARQGIYCEHTAAANYAAYLRWCELHGPAPDSVIPMCGAGLKSDH